MKNTSYSEMKNQLLVISFNQPVTVDAKEMFQPILIESRGEAWTPEGAVYNVNERQPIGDVTDTKLTSEEIYKLLYSISPVLAEMFNRLNISAVDDDPKSTADVSEIKPILVSDLPVQPSPVEIIK
jgi:hypothetical protein